MSNIISIDTSTTYCSVALHQNGKEVFALNLGLERASSSLLTTMIQTSIDQVGIALADIDAFAVAAGPGSYTGLRVSTSTAKGLCFALDKPLIAVNTLEAMARQVIPMTAALMPNMLYVPMIDARRMEVYSAVYDASGDTIEEVTPVIVDENSYAIWLEKGPVLFFGDGSAKCKEILSNSSNAYFLTKEIVPLASTVGEIAHERFVASQFEDIVTFEPFYLKAFMVKTKAN